MSADTVQQFVKNEIKFVTPQTTTIEVFQLMQKNNIHHVPVVEDGKAIGIISDRDVSFVGKTGNSLDLSAKDIMTPDPITVDNEMSIPHAINLMRQNRVNSVLIKDKTEKVIGIFTSTDALDVLAKHYQ